MKNFYDTIGNRTRVLPACSAVPQPTVPPRVPQTFLSTQSNVKLKIVLALPTYWGFALCKIITVTKVVPLSDVTIHRLKALN